jgi:two-component system, OmpR family, response regulator
MGYGIDDETSRSALGHSEAEPWRTRFEGMGNKRHRNGKAMISSPGGRGEAESSVGEPALGGRICILDHQRDRLQAASRLFQVMGCEVLAVDHLIGASNRIRSFQPDILVVDVLMPSISGPALVEVLRRNLTEMPLLILYSDLEESELARMARQTGAADFVCKKDAITALASKVRFHLEQNHRTKGF